MEFLKYKSSINYALIFAAFSFTILPPEYMRLVSAYPDAGVLPHWATIKDLGTFCVVVMLILMLAGPHRQKKPDNSYYLKNFLLRPAAYFMISEIASFYDLPTSNVFFLSLTAMIITVDFDLKAYTTQSIKIQSATVIASLLIGTMIIHQAKLKLNQHMAQSVASADAFYENGQFEEAQELLQDAIKIHQKNDLKINLAKVILKNPESTKNDFEKVFSMVGDSTKLEQLIKTTALYCSEGQESAMNFVKQLNTEKSANLDISTSEIALLSPCKKESSSDLRMPASEETAAKN
jgi:hypothetical protein